jgi:hypothetical protein
MSASASPSKSRPNPLHAPFLTQVLPRVERHGRVYFRHVKSPDRKEELLAELRGLAWKWYVRLVRRGKDVLAFVSALATYAARAVNSGRRVCGHERKKDVLSPVAQRLHGFYVGKLPDFSTLDGNPLEDALVDNTVSPVPDQVAFRLDFPAWLTNRPVARRPGGARRISPRRVGKGTGPHTSSAVTERSVPKDSWLRSSPGCRLGLWL